MSTKFLIQCATVTKWHQFRLATDAWIAAQRSTK